MAYKNINEKKKKDLILWYGLSEYTKLYTLQLQHSIVIKGRGQHGME